MPCGEDNKMKKNELNRANEIIRDCIAHDNDLELLEELKYWSKFDKRSPYNGIYAAVESGLFSISYKAQFDDLCYIYESKSIPYEEFLEKGGQKSRVVDDWFYLQYADGKIAKKTPQQIFQQYCATIATAGLIYIETLEGKMRKKL